LGKKGAERIQEKVLENENNILDFLREIVAIPSMNSQIEAVGNRIAEEMRKLNFKDVRFDKMGNIMGRVGNG